MLAKGPSRPAPAWRSTSPASLFLQRGEFGEFHRDQQGSDQLGRRRVLWGTIVLMLAGIALTLLTPLSLVLIGM
ncbi:hypothetical protein, partial [Pseudomonas protegens]|uniref:hypothetical protein n=1 Tax=Pseudomonas protegens TaxID=380021 RepID=UPI001B318F67